MSNLTYYLKVGLISIITLIVTVGLVVMYFTGSFSKVKDFVYQHIGPAPAELTSSPGRVIVLAKTNPQSLSGLLNISVPINKVELQNDKKQWVTVTETGTTTLLLDPVKNKGIGQVIANSTAVPNGTYVSVRYTFGNVTVVKSDKSTAPATLTSNTLTIPTTIPIKTNSISTISISFIPKVSIFNSKGAYTFAPQAVLETHDDAHVYTTSDNSIAISTDSGNLVTISTVKTYNDGSTENKKVAVNPQSTQKPIASPPQTEFANPEPSKSPDINQNDFLIFVPITDKYVTSNTPLSFRVSATNNSGLPISYSAAALPPGASFNESSATFTWTPTTAGTYAANFVASDGHLISSLTVAIIVNSNVVVNPSPTPPDPSPSPSPSSSPITTSSPLPSPTPTPTPPTLHKTYAYLWIPAKNNASDRMVYILPVDGELTSNVMNSNKDTISHMPDGNHVVRLYGQTDAMSSDPQDQCTNPYNNQKFNCAWWDHGAQVAGKQVEDTFAGLKNIGVQIDYLAGDYEDQISSDRPDWFYNIRPTTDYKTTALYAIEHDARWPALHQKMLDLGFTPDQPPTEQNPEGTTTVQLLAFSKPPKIEDYIIFNVIAGHKVLDYNKLAVEYPVEKSYPNIEMSNFAWQYYSKSFPVPDAYGNKYFNYTNGDILGSNQAPVTYGYVSPNTGYAGEPLAFTTFRYEVNVIRSATLASTKPVDPWVAGKNFGSGVYATSDYYQELVFHHLLAGSKRILFFNHPGSVAEDQLMQDLLEQYDEVTLGARESLVTNLASWNQDFVISGAKNGGYNFWRFTPSASGNNVPNDTLVSTSNNTVVFKAGTKNITFANAEIVTPSKNLSSLGYWIKQTGSGGYTVAESTSSLFKGMKSQLANILDAIKEFFTLIK